MTRLFPILTLAFTIGCGGVAKDDQQYTDCIDAAALTDLICRCDSNEKLGNCTEDCADGPCIDGCLDKADNRMTDCDTELTVATGTCDLDYPDAVYVSATGATDTSPPAGTASTTGDGKLDCPDGTTATGS